MSASDALNSDQHMNHAHIKSLTSHKGVREILGKLVDNDVKFIASAGNEHIKLKIVGDGLVHLSKTPSDSRAIKNIQGDIQRNIRQSINPEWKFPK